MAVDDFDIFRAIFGSDEADSPLVVNPNRMLARTIAAQRLQTVPGRKSQIIKRSGMVENCEHVARSLDQVCREPFPKRSSKALVASFPSCAHDHDAICHAGT